MERRRLRELERQRVAGERGGMRLRERLPDRDRPLLDRRQDRAPPRFLQLLQLDARRLGGAGAGGGGARRARGSRSAARRTARRASPASEPLEPKSQRLARQVRRRPRHLDERELERQARIAALAHVVDRDGEQVDQPHAPSPAGSWFACSRSRSRASSVTGSESGTSPMCCTSSRWRRCSSRSVTSRPRS